MQGKMARTEHHSAWASLNDGSVPFCRCVAMCTLLLRRGSYVQKFHWNQHLGWTIVTGSHNPTDVHVNKQLAMT